MGKLSGGRGGRVHHSMYVKFTQEAGSQKISEKEAEAQKKTVALLDESSSPMPPAALMKASSNLS
jgi:hypothetical protein